MEYAVVKIGGSQYKVKEGDEIEVFRLPQKEGEKVKFSEVLLVVSSGLVKIGQPYLEGFSVEAKVISQFKGEKIRVAKYKAKARYRKVKGFRASLTKIRIEKISNTESLKKTETQKTTKVKKVVKTSSKTSK